MVRQVTKDAADQFWSARDVVRMHAKERPPWLLSRWYFSEEEIECYSPSRKHGIDEKSESKLRRSYSSFLQDLGMQLKIPQVTIAAAIILCHRFYMCQSHTENDWQTIAIVSLFLACKSVDTPRAIKDIIIMAYEILHGWDPSASQRIREKEVYDKQKELILIGERLLLYTIAFDVDIQLPYKPLIVSLKGLGLCDELAKVAWNFVNDWLPTTLCLQYAPNCIAAGSVFLAAKYQKVKLSKGGGEAWWLKFDISPQQLQEVTQQMLKLLGQDRKEALPSLHKRLLESETSTLQVVNSNFQSFDSNVKSVTSNPCQTSDSGTGSSVVEDNSEEAHLGVGEPAQDTSLMISPFLEKHCEINVNRIKEALKRRKCKRFADENSFDDKSPELGSEAWIERKLEEGI